MNLSTYIKDIQKELKLTTFPNQQTVINFTLFVIIFTAAMAVYLGALDLGFGDAIIQGINKYSTNGPKAIISTTTNATSTQVNPSTIFTNPIISTTTAK